MTTSEHTQLLLFAHLGESSDPAKPVEYWVPVTREELAERSVVVHGPSAKTMTLRGLTRDFRSAVPGAVFAVTLTENGVRYAKHSLPVDYYQDADAVAAWRATTVAIQRAARATRSLKTLVAKRLDTDALLPFHRAFLRLNTTSRAQLIAEVVRVITTGK